MLDFDEVELFHDAEHQRMKEEARAWPTIDVYDKNWVHVTRLAAEIAGDCEDICNDAGEANFPMYASNPVAEWLSEEVEEEEDVHLIIEQSRTRWAGKVRKIGEVMESDGLEYSRVNAILARLLLPKPTVPHTDSGTQDLCVGRKCEDRHPALAVPESDAPVRAGLATSRQPVRSPVMARLTRPVEVADDHRSTWARLVRHIRMDSVRHTHGELL